MYAIYKLTTTQRMVCMSHKVADRVHASSFHQCVVLPPNHSTVEVRPVRYIECVDTQSGSYTGWLQHMVCTYQTIACVCLVCNEQLDTQHNASKCPSDRCLIHLEVIELDRLDTRDDWAGVAVEDGLGVCAQYTQV